LLTRRRRQEDGEKLTQLARAIALGSARELGSQRGRRD
jgi:hypothetical protein